MNIFSLVDGVCLVKSEDREGRDRDSVAGIDHPVSDGSAIRAFVGIGASEHGRDPRPRTTATELVLVYESGVLGAKPTYLPLTVADAILAKAGVAVVSLPSSSTIGSSRDESMWG